VPTTIGPFELSDTLPKLNEPRMLVALQPWVDVGSVGTMTLAFLGEMLDAQPLGQLARPGRFFDFTRYRPVLTREGGQRQVSVPNTHLHHAKGDDRDWILLHALEPHANGDEFVEGLIELVVKMGVTEYVLAGSMYAPVPHTRRPVASGGSTSEVIRTRLLAAGVRESNYEGPTTILALLSTSIPSSGIDTTSIILQLPAYAQVERDYMGLETMLEVLSGLYDLHPDLDAVREEAGRQRQALDETAREDPRLSAWLQELERVYDAESGAPEEPAGDEPALSPELEKFLRDVERRWSES
jgi:predicted ATP-grasp superfamily ATP-dependent carboligase